MNGVDFPGGRETTVVHRAIGISKLRLLLGTTILISLALSVLLTLSGAPRVVQTGPRDGPRQALDTNTEVQLPLARGVESAELIRYLLSLAKDSSVDVVSIEALEPEVMRVGEVDFATFRYGIQLRARRSQLVAFLNVLEQSRDGQNPSHNVARNVYLDALVANPQSDEGWLVSAQLFALASSD